MASVPKTQLDGCETLMLDMDGTVLDLAYDNFMWKQCIPQRYAEENDMPLSAARDYLFALFAQASGNLEWYCLDHWSERLGIDVLGLHQEMQSRIDYLPGAKNFLRQVSETPIDLLLVTNSHHDTLRLKQSVTGLGSFFEGIHSSHTYGHAKEHQQFWCALQEAVEFDPKTTVFVDDTRSVLRSAVEFGIGRVVEIAMPDSSEAARPGGEFDRVERLADLLD